PKRTLALVSHADVIKAIISHYLGQPFDLFQRIVISPASVSVIDLPTDGPPAVVAVNASGAERWWRRGTWALPNASWPAPSANRAVATSTSRSPRREKSCGCTPRNSRSPLSGHRS